MTEMAPEADAGAHPEGLPGANSPMDAGVQPLDALMSSLGWHNHELVVRCPAGLTHKAVQKARRGRRITRRMQQKILEAVNAAAGEGRRYGIEELFNYRGR